MSLGGGLSGWRNGASIWGVPGEDVLVLHHFCWFSKASSRLCQCPGRYGLLLQDEKIPALLFRSLATKFLSIQGKSKHERHLCIQRELCEFTLSAEDAL